MRNAGTLSWLLGDHLGSTSITANSGGTLYSELRYKAWGESRYTNGSTPTSYHFTGQREESTIGLYYYGARWYDAYLGRWTQPDSIIPQPGDPQSLNRYTYAKNNPVSYTDPSGHTPWFIAAAVGTALDVGFDWVIARATGSQFDLGRSLSVNASVNLATAGLGGKLTKLGKLAGLAKAAVSVGADVVASTAYDVAVEGQPVGESLVSNAGASIVGQIAGTAAGKATRHTWQAFNFGSNRGKTLVPTSFDLEMGGDVYHVHPNATEHMEEYARTHGGTGEYPLSNLAMAIQAARDQGLQNGRNYFKFGDSATGIYEIGIDSTDNTVFHFLYTPGE